MKEKWDSSQKLLIFSMVLAGATLVFVLIKLILEPRPNIFLIVFVILLCLMFPAGVYHIIFETNYLSPGHGHNHGRHDYDHNSVYEPDYEPVNERRIRERLDREMKKSRSGMPAEQLAFARSAAAAAGYIEGSEQMSPGFRNAIWKELNALAGGNAILENELWVIFRHGGSDWHRTCSFAGGRDKLRHSSAPSLKSSSGTIKSRIPRGRALPRSHSISGSRLTRPLTCSLTAPASGGTGTWETLKQ